MSDKNINNAADTILDAVMKPKDYSDAGAAEKFAEMVQGYIKWCDSLGWITWDGKRWAEDEHEATRQAMAFAEAMRLDALNVYKASAEYDDKGNVTVPAEVKEYVQYAKKLRNAYAIQSFMTLAKSYLTVRADQLDSQWWVLNTAAGIVDLRTGEITRHNPEALCTKIAPFSPSDNTEGVDLWHQQLILVTGGDTEYMEYLQIKAGSYAFGKIFREGMDCAIGGGRNGKSTLYNAITLVMGDYAGVIDSAVLTTDRQNKGAELATLRGKRLVIAAELEEGTRMSVSTVKRITSTDKIKVERKYHDPEEITPSHSIVLFSNYLPRVGSTDAGTWRRIEVLPFTATMPEGNADIPNYAQELADKAGSAVLSWIIEGARKYAEAGYHVTPPKAVLEATQAYKDKEDWLSNFLSECCIVERGKRVRAGDLYNRYRAYAANTGEYCRRNTDFHSAMVSAGFLQTVTNGKKHWNGLDIDYAHPYFADGGQGGQSRRYS